MNFNLSLVLCCEDKHWLKHILLKFQFTSVICKLHQPGPLCWICQFFNVSFNSSCILWYCQFTPSMSDLYRLHKRSNELRMIALSTSLFCSPVDNWYNTLEWKQSSSDRWTIGNVDLIMDLMLYRTTDLAPFPGEPQIVQHHLCIKHSLQAVVGPLPKITWYFLFSLALSGLQVLQGQLFHLAKQNTCLYWKSIKLMCVYKLVVGPQEAQRPLSSALFN